MIESAFSLIVYGVKVLVVFGVIGLIVFAVAINLFTWLCSVDNDSKQ